MGFSTIADELPQTDLFIRLLRKPAVRRVRGQVLARMRTAQEATSS